MSFGAEISQMQVKNISSDYTKKKIYILNYQKATLFILLNHFCNTPTSILYFTIHPINNKFSIHTNNSN